MKNSISIITLAIYLLLSGCKKDDPQVGIKFPIPSDVGGEVAYISIDAPRAIVDEPKVPATMTITKDDIEVATEMTIAIELRGSTSQTEFAKKSYGIELRDEENMDISMEILGLPSEEDWILYGPYSDKTFLRNWFAYRVSNNIGRYASRTQWVELSINDSFRGAYLLMEKLKRDENRIDIESLEEMDTDPNLISGGYILKIDKTSTSDGNSAFDYNATNSFRSDYNPVEFIINYLPYQGKKPEETYFLYEYPDRRRINNAQRQYIKSYIAAFEDALIAEQFQSNDRPYWDYIDVNSFVDNFILNELCGNVDAYRLSSFLHKSREGKLTFGPIWDFNIALGNDGRSTTDQWVYLYNQLYPSDLWLVHFWWTKMLKDPLIKDAIKARWTSLRSNELSNATLLQLIDAEASYLQNNNIVNHNYERWNVLDKFLPFNSQVAGTYQGEVDYMKDWLTRRLAWMDSEIEGW